MTTRRNFMVGAAAGATTVPLIAAPSLAGATTYNGNTLVVMFMRGGCDGLSLFPPVGEAAYHDARPTVAVSDTAALALAGPGADSNFGWNPGAARLSEFFDAGRVAVVPAAGSPDHSRSHFDCQDGIEAGRPEDRRSVSGGWIGRYLAGTASSDHPLRAFSAGTGIPPSMRGYGAISAPSIDRLGLLSWGPEPAWAREAIAAGYSAERAGGDLAMWAGVTLGALDEIEPLLAGEVSPPDGWPGSSVARLLFTIARLLEAGLPVQMATVDLGGWDHHDNIGSATDPNSRTRGHINVLDSALGAFFDRLDAAGLGSRVTVATMTEFGRRVGENDSGGADHGYGGPMVVVGGGVSPGVKGPWPTVAEDALDRGDLAVTVDQRTVMSELLASRLGSGDLSGVFPGFNTSPGTFVGVAA